jgi:6-phosphogluconolactonase
VGGKWPRNFCIDPTGGYILVANKNTNNVVAFGVDPSSGRLTPTGQSITVAMPVCVKFAAVGAGGGES